MAFVQLKSNRTPSSSTRLFNNSISVRYCSSQQTTYLNDNISKHEPGQAVVVAVVEKQKRHKKTQLAKSLARLINNSNNNRSWSTQLESSLSSLTPSSPSLSKTTFQQTLRLIQNPTKALQFFTWVSTKKGFTHDSHCFFIMLEILGQSRNLNAARNFLLSIEKKSNGLVKLDPKYFNSLIKSYGDAGLFDESIKVFTLMKTIGVSPSVVSFNTLLSILLKRGRTNMAKSLFDEMLQTYGVTPDIYSFNILIRGFSKNLMVEVAFRFFEEMGRFKCDPDIITYNTLVDGLCQAGKVKIARNLVNGMSKKKDANLQPNVVTFTTLIRGYSMKREIDEALSVLEEMKSRGLKPNAITYNTLIQGLCEARNFDKIKDILEGTDFSPDTCTFNTLINSHCSVGNLDEAMKVFKRMSELRVPPDSATYSILIRGLCQKGEFERAGELLDKLYKNGILVEKIGCTPLVAAYNPMLEYLCQNGKAKKAENLFRQLMKRGTQDPPSYKTLIMGHCKEGNFRAGYEILVLMLRRNFVPDCETYESLISGLLQQGEPVLAFETLEKMLKSSHLPRTSMFHSTLAELLKNRLHHQSASLVLLMLEKRIRQDISLSTDTVRLLFEYGIRDKAFNILHLLYDNWYVVKMDEIVEFLCKNKKLLEACKILIFSLEKKQTVNHELCNVVINGLCKINKLSEAFELFFGLVEVGVHQQMSCLEELKVALAASGKLKEAEYVSKRIPEKVQPEKSSGKF
ncbi:hypothetical protein ACFE04_016698 [Oxalis oulophora]